MKLPNGDRAVVDIRKLREYCLNPKHTRGGSVKADGFSKTLGITVDDAAAFRELLLEAAATADAEQFGKVPQGELFTVDAMITWRGRHAVVRTGWIVRQREDFPRLTTAFVISPGR